MPDVPHDEPEDARPWERPGAVRKDYEPHRGNLLAWVGMAAMLGTAFVPGLGLILLPLSASVRATARADLARMHAGIMQPEGRPRTREALEYATVALILAPITAAAAGAAAGALLWFSHH